MEKARELVKEIEAMQKELDYRTEIENRAIALTSECRFEEAIELLKLI